MRTTFLLLVCALALAARGGVVHLKDGGTLEGDVKKADDGWVVTDASGNVTRVAADKVSSIQLKPTTQPDGDGNALASLRRSTENLSDIPQILDRYRSFQKQYAGTPAAKDAQADIEMWRSRLDQGLVKIGPKWVTKEEQGKLREQSLTAAAQARRLLIEGHLKDAVVPLQDALTIDPQNPAALYLRAVLLYRQEQFPAARKSFETVAALVHDHAPTLNNLAVLLWRQNGVPGALNYYDQAMLAAPASRPILDNVAEALHALPEDQRNTALVKKVVKHFNDQDDALAAQMRRQGLYRWGSSWVTQSELDRLTDAEAQIKEKLAALSSDFDAVKDRIAQIDRDMEDTQRSMRRIEASTYVRDAQGNVTRLSYPRVYYDLAHDLDNLKAERDTQVAKLDRLRKKANDVQQSLPVPKYAGAQRIIDVEGAPLLPALPPPPPPADVRAPLRDDEAPDRAPAPAPNDARSDMNR